MTDYNWTDATTDLADGDYGSSNGRLLIRMSGSPGAAREARLDRFVTRTAAGKVAIGTSSGQAQFHVNGTVAASIPSLGAAPNDFFVGPAAAYGMMFGVLSNGNGYIQQQRSDGTPTPYNLLLQPNGGDVGIGTNTPTSRLHVVAPNGDAARFQSSGGQVAYIYADDSNIGFFNVAGAGVGRDGFLINSGAISLEVNATAVATATPAGLLAGGDNAYTLGGAANRWSVAYVATGAINTSDAREKTWRGALNEAELRAASRIAREIGVYQWNDAIEEKGADKARLHVGLRAQAVWAIMADEGLVDPIAKNGKPGATPYAFLCWDKWDDKFEDEMIEEYLPPSICAETGEEIPTAIVRRPTGKKVLTRPAGDRFGVRVDQLALFIAAAQEQRLAALEGRA